MTIEDHGVVPKTVDEALDQLVLANRILANEGILDALGHVSVRNPNNWETFYLSRSLSPELVTREDMMEIDLEGRVLTETDKRPYSERFIHAAILKGRPDVNAVFHGHPHEVIPFSSTGVPIRPMAHFASLFFEGVPLYDDYDVSSGLLISTLKEAQRLGRVLGNARAVLLRDHGCCVVGENIPAMVMGAIYLRDNAKIQLQALQLGQPKYLSYEEGREAATRMVSPGAIGIERAWEYWVRRAKKSMSI